MFEMFDVVETQWFSVFDENKKLLIFLVNKGEVKLARCEKKLNLDKQGNFSLFYVRVSSFFDTSFEWQKIKKKFKVRFPK